jgi:hypothetical protein
MGPAIRQRGAYFAVLNRDWVFPPSARANASVIGAGSPAVNGNYDYDGSKWTKGVYIIDKSPNWTMRDGTTTYYTAAATEFPWQAIWAVGAGGSAPAPAVNDGIN